MIVLCLVWLPSDRGPINVCLFTKMSQFHNLKPPKMCFHFSVLFTHYSKIKELSDENKFNKPFYRRTYQFWVMSDEKQQIQTTPKIPLSDHLDSTESYGTFSLFFFVNSNLTWIHCAGTKITIYALFIIVHNTGHALKNIKNGSYDTIHTFKNYFVTVLSVFSFSNNKFNPNGTLIHLKSKLMV